MLRYLNVIRGHHIKDALLLLVAPMGTGILSSTFRNGLPQTATTATGVRHVALEGVLREPIGLEELEFGVKNCRSAKVIKRNTKDLLEQRIMGDADIIFS